MANRIIAAGKPVLVPWARADTFDDIERVDNPRRQHAKPGCLGPMAFAGHAIPA
jgi:hypothetical protein